MADSAQGRRFVVTAAGMAVVGQVLAIANDVVLGQNDPADVVMLVLLIVLGVLMLRRVRWARWVTVALVALGGLLELFGVALLVATVSAPGFWPAAEGAVPALASLHTAVTAFVAARAFPLLVGSVGLSAVLDCVAAWLLAFAAPVRSFFVPTP